MYSKLISASTCFSVYPTSKNKIGNLSFIPSCFFGKKTQKYWKSEEYGMVQALNQIFPEEYQKFQESEHNLDPTKFYKYPGKIFIEFNLEIISLFQNQLE